MKPKKECKHVWATDIKQKKPYCIYCFVFKSDIPSHPNARTCREKVNNLSREVPCESLISSQVSDGSILNKEIENLKNEIDFLYKYPPASMTMIKRNEKKLAELLNKSE